ncbi:CDP-alcohol phosphatidyltransferase family protein [Candidatus Scalindua japonica]|uniref:CDP-alcohol phosphatidyltransferase family protein n=1 Tax=Candidatus Scalindua japonica TaxID=1284222 RepID=UPI0013A5B409|nr:phosphatidylcholine/phosphatidylserine synthase [Candidatus Scalindua japonica]
MMNQLKNYSPTIVSIGNLACGFGAIVFIMNNEQAYAAWLVILAMIFDGLDGQVARLTKTTITWGAHLDTLADMITFGFVPAFLIGKQGAFDAPIAIWFVCFFYTLSAAIRLAKFEFESEKSNSSGKTRSKYFTGLPSTLAGGTAASLILLDSYLKTTLNIQAVSTCLPCVIFILGMLMLSKVPYIRIIDLVGSKRDPVSLLITSVLFFTLLVFFILYPSIMLALGFCVYILIGLGKHGIHRRRAIHIT